MPGGRSSRQKGDRRERELVQFWTGKGVKAERVPLSGAAGGSYSGDVDLYLRGSEQAPLVGEVKGRKDGEGFKTLARWLGENDLLVLHQDRSERLYVIPERVMAMLVGKA